MANIRATDARAPMFSGEQLRERLREYDREPFLDLLAVFLECAPTPNAVRQHANRNPHLYANALGHLGKLAGFADRREIEHTGKVDLHHLSDSELEDRLRASVTVDALGFPRVIEHVPAQEKPPAETEGSSS